MTMRERIEKLRVIPVLRLGDRSEADTAIDCLLEAGFGSVEITLTTPDALGLISALRARVGAEFLIGAGTVLDLDEAQRCVEAGADYLVSPCLVPGLAAFARSTGRAALVGGFTPGEVLAAWRDGAEIVKVFPASSGGVSHLSALHAIFPHIPLCPTGGVSRDNMLDYFKAGACVVGVGNNVIDRKALAAGARAQVVRHARGFLETAAEVG